MDSPKNLRVITDAAFNGELKQAGGGIVFSSWDHIVDRVFAVDLKNYNIKGSEQAEMVTACIAMNLAEPGSIRFLTNDSSYMIEKLKHIKDGKRPKKMSNAFFKYVRDSINRHPDIVFMSRSRDRRMMVMADSLSRVGMFSKDETAVTEFFPKQRSADDPAIPSQDLF